MSRSLPVVQRSCGDCTKCCEGWLEARIDGRMMYNGNPCHHLQAGCDAYEARPDVCRTYSCAWLQEPEVFPGWMKPSLTGVILNKITTPGRDDLAYYEVAEAGAKMPVEVLNWLLHWSLDNGVDLHYEVCGKHHTLGKQSFRSEMRRK